MTFQRSAEALGIAIPLFLDPPIGAQFLGPQRPHSAFPARYCPSLNGLPPNGVLPHLPGTSGSLGDLSPYNKSHGKISLIHPRCVLSKYTGEGQGRVSVRPIPDRICPECLSPRTRYKTRPCKCHSPTMLDSRANLEQEKWAV